MFNMAAVCTRDMAPNCAPSLGTGLMTILRLLLNDVPLLNIARLRTLMTARFPTNEQTVEATLSGAKLYDGTRSNSTGTGSYRA